MYHFTSLIANGAMFRLDRKPEPPTESPDGKLVKKKWPKEVVLANNQVFSEKAFFNWTHKEKTSSFWGWLIVGLALCILLFPLWPMLGKKAVFYISLYLLIFLVNLDHLAWYAFDQSRPLHDSKTNRL